MLEANSANPTKLTFSVKEASQQTSLSNSHIRNEIRAGHLRAKRIGRRVLILCTDLQNYLNGKEDWKPADETQN